MKPYQILIIGILLLNLFSTNAYCQNKDDEVFSFVQDVPAFPAGDEAMLKFLRENVKYPKIDKSKKVEGSLLVSFIVEKNGGLTDIKIIKGMSEELNEEVLRVVKMMPPWVPGMQNGKRVRVEQHLTLKFSSKGKLIEAK